MAIAFLPRGRRAPCNAEIWPSRPFSWPAIFRLLLGSYDFLAARGYQPEAVLTELWGSGESAEVLERMAEVGIFRQMDYHSATSQYGTLSYMERALPPDLEQRMDDILAEIRDGSFAREWELEQEKGYPTFTKLKQAALQQPVNAVEQRVRGLMGRAGRE